MDMTKGSTFCASLQSSHSTGTRSLFTYDFRVNFAALHPQLVDLRLCDVSPLLSFLQFMLDLAEFGEICVGLLLLRIETES